VTVVAMWFAYPGPPGSSARIEETPEPDADVPVSVTATDESPAQTVLGDALDGVAGGGAFSWTARTAQLFAGLSRHTP